MTGERNDKINARVCLVERGGERGDEKEKKRSLVCERGREREREKGRERER